MLHKILSHDKATRRGVCSVCGDIDIKLKPKGEGYVGIVCGNVYRDSRRRYWKSASGRATRKKNRHNESPWRKHIKPLCEKCGYIPLDLICMDGHHRDENRKNNSTENIASLCPSCHRLIHAGKESLIVPFMNQTKQEKPDVNVMKLLEDVDRLTKENSLFEKRREAWLRATESQQVAYWRDRALKAEGLVKKGEFDQTV